MTMTTTSVGTWAEDIAADHLRKLGWNIIERNYRYKKLGEIDIIARDGDMVVFVEVRYRTSTRYGLPEASLLPRKIGRLRRTALMWLTMHAADHPPCRCDVVALDMAGGEVVLRHFRNAF